MLCCNLDVTWHFIHHSLPVYTADCRFHSHFIFAFYFHSLRTWILQPMRERRPIYISDCSLQTYFTTSVPANQADTPLALNTVPRLLQCQVPLLYSGEIISFCGLGNCKSWWLVSHVCLSCRQRRVSGLFDALVHGCTNFWLAWAALSKEESSWATYIICRSPKIMPPIYFREN